MGSGSGFQMGDRQIPDRYDAHMWRFMEPHVDALLDAAEIRPGDAVIDVACGTGFAARTASARGAEPVVGTDVNPGMLAAARRRNSEITWVEASALDLPFDDDEFDVAICSQGVQFFPEPAVGLREIARIASRSVVTAWAARADVPWFDAHIPMLVETCGLDPAMMEMSFSDESEVRRWFGEAGLAVNVSELRTAANLPADFSVDYLSALPWGEPFFGLDDAARRDALSDVAARLDPYRTADGDLVVPFTSWLVTSR